MSVVGVAPHFEVLSLRIMLFLVPTFFLVFRLLNMCFIRQRSVQCDANIHREVAVGLVHRAVFHIHDSVGGRG